ncbi:MAG: ParB/RepB/Spo0J family partition protein [Rhodospirillales bacterium]|nr:ParB/RepB/Spo0J family partition protein [Rhodospirillales bacterium]
MSGTRGLGRGLSALIGEPTPTARTDAVATDGLRTLPIGHLRPGRFQPRTRFDERELDNLAASLTASGMMQPIVARPVPGEHNAYEIVAGERRWRAAQKARLHDVPVIVRKLSDREVLELGLIENLQRQDLGPLEEAAGYERLRKEFALTQMDIATMVGRSRAHVANMVRLLGLPPAVRRLLDLGRISAGHGRALLASPDPEALAGEIVTGGLSVRETESRAGACAPTKSRSGRTRQLSGPQSADIRDLEHRLAEATGLRVEVLPKGEKGKLVLNYANLKQLDEVIARLEAPPRPRPVRT